MIFEKVTGSQIIDILDESMVVIGVDAPLGFPSEFIKLVSGTVTQFDRPVREIENRLAYRDTDIHIYQEFGKKPLSPVFDKLGNNCTVAITHINKWCKELGYSFHSKTQSPSDKKVIIEVYPALVKTSQASEAKQPIKELLPIDLPHGTDAYDAAICAIMAVAYGADGRYANLPKLVGPPNGLNSVIVEGWIYHLPKGTFV